MGQWIIEPYSSGRHVTNLFSCGSAPLDDYIRRYATQDVRRRLATVFVAREPEALLVRGYYSVSAASFSRDDLPLELARKLPRYPVPASIMGRLGVDAAAQGQGLGEYLLIDCMKRVLAASCEVAVYALVVDAKDELSKRFYLKYGFLEFVDRPLRLFIPLSTILKASLPSPR